MTEITTITQISPMTVTITTTKIGSPGPQGLTGSPGGVTSIVGQTGIVSAAQISSAAATPSTIPLRDSSGRMKAAAPAASDDVATYDYTRTLRLTGLNPITVGYSSTWAPNAALGNIFRITLSGNVTINGPSNPTDGQQVILEVTQDGTGGRTISLQTGVSGSFSFGSDISAVTPSTAAGKMDRIVAMYRTASSRWEILSILRGF